MVSEYIKIKFLDRLPSKQLLEILVFGIISGIPFSIILTVLTTWLKEAEFEKSTITLILGAKIFYGFKYLWAPAVDRIKLPILSMLGKRKSWMVLSILTTMASLVFMSFTDPKTNFSTVYYLAFVIGFSSATYDIAFDAFRIDTIKDEEQGYAAACAVLGYRIGMLISSSFSLIISEFYGWQCAFLFLSSVFVVLLVYLPFLNEPKKHEVKNISFIEKINEAVINPFVDFFKRNNAILIVTAIILYKLGGVLLAGVSNIFFIEIGYSKLQIGTIVKLWGFWATIIGSFFGGYIVSRIGILRGLIVCGFIQAFVHVIYIWLNHTEVSNLSLAIAISIENIGSASGSAAEVAYLSYLCNKNYSATQYALLSCLAVLLNSLISIKSGAVVESVGWDYFFLGTVLLSFPAILIFIYIDRKNRSNLV